MKYSDIVKGTFVSRPNRFIAHVIIDGKEEILTEGDCHYCKKGQTHTLINIGEEDLIFYAVVPQQ